MEARVRPRAMKERQVTTPLGADCVRQVTAFPAVFQSNPLCLAQQKVPATRTQTPAAILQSSGSCHHHQQLSQSKQSPPGGAKSKPVPEWTWSGQYLVTPRTSAAASCAGSPSRNSSSNKVTSYAMQLKPLDPCSILQQRRGGYCTFLRRFTSWATHRKIHLKKIFFTLCHIL